MFNRNLHFMSSKATRYCHTWFTFPVIAKPIKDTLAGLWNKSVDNSPLIENKKNMEFLKFAYNSISLFILLFRYKKMKQIKDYYSVQVIVSKLRLM